MMYAVYPTMFENQTLATFLRRGHPIEVYDDPLTLRRLQERDDTVQREVRRLEEPLPDGAVLEDGSGCEWIAAFFSDSAPRVHEFEGALREAVRQRINDCTLPTIKVKAKAIDVLTLRAKWRSFTDLVLTHQIRSWSGLLDLSYRAAFVQEFSVASTHNIQIGWRTDFGPWFGGITLSYGRGRGDYEAWGYDLNTLQSGGELGAAWDVSSIRLGLAATAEVAYASVKYRDGTMRGGTSIS
jgi:hypothetical protein